MICESILANVNFVMISVIKVYDLSKLCSDTVKFYSHEKKKENLLSCNETEFVKQLCNFIRNFLNVFTNVFRTLSTILVLVAF